MHSSLSISSQIDNHHFLEVCRFIILARGSKKMGIIKKFILGTLVFYTLVIISWWLFVRPAYFNWGATDDETQMKIPGDEFIHKEAIVSTRAIDIHADPEKIYAWIVQTGQNKGGFNSYTWLENLLGANMKNAISLHPEWQKPQPGDTVYFGEDQLYALVSTLKPGEYYSIGGWTFYLKKINDETTRLIVRYPSMDVRGNWFNSIYYYSFFEAIHFLMETRMMAGIKYNAEKF